jgi:acetylcholinesterase
LFSLAQTNVTRILYSCHIEGFTDCGGACRTDAEFRAYLQEFFLPNASDAELDKVLTLYSSASPSVRHTTRGTNNTLTPEFKHMASFLGDLKFHGPRRYFLQNVSGKQSACLFPSLFVHGIAS